MNPKLVATSMAFVSIAVGFALTALAAGDEASKVEQLEKDMHQAQKDNDVAWYEKHVADGYVEGHSWGEWATKAEAIRQAKEKANKVSKGEISEMKVAMFGPKIAVAHYKFTYDATFNGTHRARAVICSDTWISQTDTWKLASNHCSHVEGT